MNKKDIFLGTIALLSIFGIGNSSLRDNIIKYVQDKKEDRNEKLVSEGKVLLKSAKETTSEVYLGSEYEVEKINQDRIRIVEVQKYEPAKITLEDGRVENVIFDGVINDGIGYKTNTYFAEQKDDGNYVVYQEITYPAIAVKQKDGTNKYNVPEGAMLIGNLIYAKVSVAQEKQEELIEVLENNKFLSLSK